MVPRFALALLFGWIGLASADELDSWCPNVKLPSSIAICSDPELRALAIERQHAFNEARGRVGEARAPALLADQNAWVREYPKACGLAQGTPSSLPLPSPVRDCMARAGRERTAYLRAYGTPAAPAPSAAVSPGPGKTGAEVQLKLRNGIYRLPVRINDAITLDFTLDSGASDVQIPADVVMTLFRTETLTENDFSGTATYILADGSKLPSARFVLRELRVGDHHLSNVPASVGPPTGELLLGQSFLSRFHSWTLDNAKHVIVLNEPAKHEAQNWQNAPLSSAPAEDDWRKRVGSPEKVTSPLTTSEMALLREQLYHCWNVPVGARDAKDLIITIRVMVGPDGIAQQATIVDGSRLGDPVFRAAAESARRTFFSPECTPLHLPAGKYELWKDLVVDFDPHSLL